MDTGAHVIPQRYAYIYGASQGKPTDHFFRAVVDACETVGFDRNDKAAQFRMMDAVLEAMPDLIQMPSDMPDALGLKKLRLGGVEATVKVNGRVAHQERV
ncbi:hypothetical protein D9M73_70790 [compost metagenome]